MKHSAHSVVGQHRQRLLLTKQISLCWTKIHQTSLAPNHLWGELAKALSPRPFSKSAGGVGLRLAATLLPRLFRKIPRSLTKCRLNFRPHLEIENPSLTGWPSLNGWPPFKSVGCSHKLDSTDTGPHAPQVLSNS